MKAKTRGGKDVKKKILLLIMVLILAVSVLAGCSKKGSEEQKTVVGMFMEKKDFMFTVQDSAGIFYGFNFDEKPENYDELQDGDQVKVTYTGTISEVDPFEGEILSIEKVN